MAFDLDHVADLALFARVVEQRSFSAAARQSGIAKSAVSRRIRLLERRVGVQLLRRTTRSVQVTAEGARLYAHGAQIVASARAADDELAGASTALRGRIRINAPVTFAQMYLTAALADFQRAHPEVELELVTDDRMVDVVADGFDLVVRVGRLADASFVARRLAVDRLVVVGSPTYLTRHGRPTRVAELVHHNCLHYLLVPLSAQWRFGRERGPAPGKSTFAANDGTVLREAAIGGLGLAVLPYFMAAPDLRAGRLELVLEGSRRAEIGIYAVVAATRGLPARVRTLVDALVVWFARPAWRE